MQQTLLPCLCNKESDVTNKPQPVLQPVFLLHSSSLSLKGLQFLLAQSEGLRAEDVTAVQLVKPPPSQGKQCLWSVWALNTHKYIHKLELGCLNLH